MLSYRASIFKILEGEEAQLKYLKEKHTTKPDNIDVLLQLIALYFSRDNVEDAKPYLKLAQKYHPEDERIKPYIEFIAKEEISAKSEEEFEALLEKEPDNKIYLNAYSDFLELQEDTEKAIAIQNRILEIDPVDLGAIIHIAHLYYLIDKKEEVTEFIHRALDISGIKTVTVIIKNYPLLALETIKLAVEKYPDDEQIAKIKSMI